jgi:hypothetical protein
MSPDDKTELQALILEAVTSAVGGLQSHLDQQILELQADVERRSRSSTRSRST